MGEGERGWDDVSGEVGVCGFCCEHLAGLLEVGRHAGFAEDVFASGEGSGGDLGVGGGPSADTNDINVLCLDDAEPILFGAMQIPLDANFESGFEGAVSYGDELDVFAGTEAGEVASAGIAAGADETDTEFRVGHKGLAWREREKD